jgi:hypothetical protein
VAAIDERLAAQHPDQPMWADDPARIRARMRTCCGASDR